MIQYPKGIVSCVLAGCFFLSNSHQGTAQDTHVFSGAEHTIFSEYSLNTVPTAAWSTDRSNTPGYFSAVDDATFQGATARTSFLVDGYIKYYRSVLATSDNFVFTVGQETDYRPVTISGTISANISVATAWFTGDPGIVPDPTDGATHDRNNKDAGVISVLSAGFWDWQTIYGTPTGMVITVSIPDVSALVQTSDLILVGWDGSKWINISGAVGDGPYMNNWANGNTEGSILSGTWQPDITALAIGSIGFLLPLKLESFTGKTNDCLSELIWKTADEENTSHFTILYSTDRVSWHSISNVAADKNSAGKEYRYTLEQKERRVWYRLLMTDNDGQETYSPTITITNSCGKDISMSVFPNPITLGTSSVKITLQSRRQTKAVLLLQNSSGQLVQRRDIALNPGNNIVNLATDLLSSGSYFLTIVDNTGQSLYPLKKIIKK
jgi:hypothetical protein